MKKQNIILVLGAAAVAAYFLMRKKGSTIFPGGMMAPAESGAGQVNPEQTDAVIDADKAKLSIPEAIDAVSAVASKIKDLKIEIKKGGQTTTVRTGKKKKAGAGKRVKPKRRVKTKKSAQAAASIAKQAVTPKPNFVTAPGAYNAPAPFTASSSFPYFTR